MLKVITIIFVAFFCLCNTALAQNIFVYNQANVPQKTLHRLEAATQGLANKDLRAYWHTPKIVFGYNRNAWMVYIENQPGLYGGVHYYGFYQPPTNAPAGLGVRAIVYVDSRAPWKIVFSHEVLEMLVDPKIDHTVFNSRIGTQLVEVCDPVYPVHFQINGIPVSDFVLPSWYQTDSQGPWDFLHVLKAPETNA